MQASSPFFLYLAYHAPHTPLDERGEFVDTPTQLDPDNPKRWLNEDKIKWFNDPEGIIQSEPDPEKRLFLAVLYHLDHGIGQVIKALDASGQRDNTLILFTSDNGPQVNWPGNAYPDDLKLTDFNQARSPSAATNVTPTRAVSVFPDSSTGAAKYPPARSTPQSTLSTG